MLIDREDTRKQQEAAYRKQLKQEVEMKRSRVESHNKKGEYRPQKQSFSLIQNIEKQQLERKRKNEDYYDELRQQIQKEKQLKKEKEEERKRRQLDQQNKLREEQQRLQQRYEQQVRREKGNKQPPQAQPQQPPPKTKQQKLKPLKRTSESPYPRLNSQHSLDDSRLNQPHQNEAIHFNTQPVSLYPNRIQNETFNYVPRKNYRESYFKELLNQRKHFEEETSHIVELNRMFNAERYRRKEQSNGLSELRNLYKALDNQGASLTEMSSSGMTSGLKSKYSDGSKLRPIKLQRPKLFSGKGNMDEWRKLD